MATPSPTAYPSPLIIPPSSGHHKTSIIVLHGRGSNAAAFADPLLLLSTTAHGTLQTAFPDAKLIFPTAPRSLVRRSKKASMNQWFDFWSLADPELRPEIQVEGLRETVGFLHGLIREESAVVGAGNVVLWGMSQGAAAGLVAMLLWEGEGIAACVGMCGWLPLRGFMEGVVREDEGGLEDMRQKSGFRKVISRVREMLDLPSESDRRENLDVPIFIGHGEDDGTVSVRLAREAASLLERVGVEVECRMYHGLDHWYSEEMLSDIIGFIKRHLKLGEVTSIL